MTSLVNKRLSNRVMQALSDVDLLAAHLDKVLEPLSNMEQMTLTESALRATRAQKDASEIRRLIQEFLPKTN